MSRNAKKLKIYTAPGLKLDFGCGKNKKEGFLGVDIIEFDGVDCVLDIGTEKWPWKDNSVEEAHASHFIEHLGPEERIHFCNELYRVLKFGAKFTMICPHWNSGRAYGDMTHKWPPVCEFWFYYLNKEWRKVNSPHLDIEHNPKGYNCHFEIVAGYNVRQDLMTMNEERRNFSLQNYKEAAQDTIAHWTKI